MTAAQDLERAVEEIRQLRARADHLDEAGRLAYNRAVRAEARLAHVRKTVQHWREWSLPRVNPEFRLSHQGILQVIEDALTGAVDDEEDE